MQRAALQRIARLTSSVAALWLAFTFAPPAAASPEYPEIVQEELEAECVPPCTLCHTDPSGGATAFRPFIETLGATVSEPPEGENPDLIRRLLREYAANPGDADGDQQDDVTELRRGEDPNTSGPGLLCANYGCGARIEPRSRFDGTAFAAALIMALGLVARLRRSSSR
jgi:hypothetical protein